MIIELDESLIGAPLDDEAVIAINLIAQARREGSHLLFGSDEVFLFLANQEGMAVASTAILRKSRARQVQKAQLLRTASWRLRVRRNGEPSIDRLDGVSVISLPIAHFAQLSAVQRPLILGENQRDALLALFMAESFAVMNGLGRTKLHLVPIGGGGATTVDAFRTYRDEPRLCICILDSDRLSPDGRIGATAEAVLREYDDEKPWAESVLHNCREAENTLSAKMIELSCGADPDLLGRIPQLEGLEASSAQITRFFGDLKGGTTLGWVLSLPADSPDFEFWLDTMRRAISHLRDVQDGCLQTERCDDPRDCRCTILPAFGERLLARTLSKFDRMTPHKIAQSLCPITTPAWMELGGLVFSWGCGTERSAA